MWVSKIASGINYLPLRFCEQIKSIQGWVTAQYNATNEIDYLFEGHIVWTIWNVYLGIHTHTFVII